MDRGLFADDVPVPEAEAGWFPAILEVLRRVAEDGAGVDDIVSAEGRVACEICEGSYPASGAEDDMLVDHGHWADFNGGIELRARVDDGRRMNHRPQR
jgi:hypothetical protein